ncbi:MAG TPA: hypothetical protein DCL49_13260 [Candidatus Omnitrophica bacterium]|nr:hypothetical protein [Candidatus Omnitrophota bacterium]
MPQCLPDRKDCLFALLKSADMPEIKSYLSELKRTSVKAVNRKKYLRLDMNENPLGLSQSFVRDVLRQVNSNTLAAYPEYCSLLKKIALHNHLKTENVCLSNGSDAVIKHIFDAYVSPGDRILLTEPTFAMYPVYCSMFNAKPLIVEYDSFRGLPVNRFLDKISSGIKMAVIVNPHNPTGSIFSQRELIKIARKARDNDVLLVIDEAYFYFYSHTLIHKINRYRNLIILRTFSKLCGIAGLRVGYAAACPEIIKGLYKVKPSFDVNSVGVLFAERLLDEPALIKKMIAQTNEGKGYLVKKLQESSIEYIAGAANFVLIRCRVSPIVIKEKLAKQNILVAAGFTHEFLKDYIRVTVADKKIMESFWKVFAKIWRRHEKRCVS